MRGADVSENKKRALDTTDQRFLVSSGRREVAVA